MKRHILTAIILVCIFPSLVAQQTLRGKVVDAHTGQPLPFVNIVYNEMGQGISTNLDGNFEIVTQHAIKTLKTSYIGYQPTVLTITEKDFTKPILIGLTPTTYDVKEVVIRPGTNPAHRIIRKVYANRQQNNPERLPQFSYNSYNKMYFTANRNTKETIANNTDTSSANDLLEQKVEKLLKKQHLFMLESVTERLFMHPNRNLETVLASKISGMKDPLLAYLATQYQSFSFFPELLNIAGKLYLNPISQNSTRRYLFILEDTLYTPSADTLFVISFTPLDNKNFSGLHGVLSINSNGYAIQNVIAEPVVSPSPSFNVKVQQHYSFIDSIQWFPVELNTTLYLNQLNLATSDSSNQQKQYALVGYGSNYIKNINLSPSLKKKDFSHVELVFSPEAANKNDTFWMQYRNDSLTKQELRTYEFVDSISRQVNLDRLTSLFDILLMGKLPIGSINVNLNRLMGYNRVEGYRLGLGLETNQRVSQWFTLGGYYAYGFQDKKNKFGGFSRVILSDLNQVLIEGSYQNDVREPGEVTFEQQQSLVNDELYRSFMVDRMDYMQKYTAKFSFRTFKRFSIGLVANRSSLNVTSMYAYNRNQLDPAYQYTTNEVGLKLKFAKREVFMKTLKGLRPLEFEYPIMWVNLFKGFEYRSTGFNYTRFETKIVHRIKYRTIGKTMLTLTGGHITGNSPTSLLYFAPGNMGSWSIDTDNAFGTAAPFEFVSDRYAYLFIRHNFGNILHKAHSKIFKPQLEIAQNCGIGNYTLANWHNFNLTQPKTLSKGFFESGVIVNGILSNQFSSLGIGAYYRWGNYAYADWRDNLALKITLTSSF